MAQAIASNGAFLRFLQQCNKNQRKALLQNLTKDQMTALSQVALNILKGHVTIKSDYIKMLRPYEEIILLLSSHGVSRLKKKKALLSHQALLPLLIKPIIPLLEDV